MNSWQYIPEHIDPIAFTVGFLSVRWYALFLLFGTVLAFAALRWEEKKRKKGTLSEDSLWDLLLFVFLGAIVGGRIGYVLFYDLPYFLDHPLAVVSPYDFEQGIWTGIAGMSFHGGLLGVTLAVFLFVRKTKEGFWTIADRLALVAPLGILFGRLGNFMNGELYGRVTEKPWGMYFPSSGTPFLLRHPSQLYEALLEGVVLFIFLFLLKKKTSLAPGLLAAIFLVGYAMTRFMVEFFREPDPQLGLVFCYLTMGQWLSLGTFFSGVVIFGWLRGEKRAILPEANR